MRLAIDIATFMNTVMDQDQIGIIFCTSKKEVDNLESFTTVPPTPIIHLNLKMRIHGKMEGING